MTALSLDCLTLPDTSPPELIRVAGEAGYTAVSLWVQPPALYETMLATPTMAADIRAALDETGVALGNLEVFNLNFDGPIADYRPTLAFGAGLGAKTATAINYGPPRGDLPERFAAFHALCAELGLETLFEPIWMSDVRTLADGAALIAAAGVEARLVVDFLHVVRSGSTPQSIAAISPGLLGHVQICDGPLRISDEQANAESTAERLYPGEGGFPLRAMIEALPAGLSLGVEAPSATRQQQGLSPLERAREAFAATRMLLQSSRS